MSTLICQQGQADVPRHPLLQIQQGLGLADDGPACEQTNIHHLPGEEGLEVLPEQLEHLQHTSEPDGASMAEDAPGRAGHWHPRRT